MRSNIGCNWINESKLADVLIEQFVVVFFLSRNFINRIFLSPHCALIVFARSTFIRSFRIDSIDSDFKIVRDLTKSRGDRFPDTMTATTFPLVRPSSWCVSWSDTARDATTGPPSGYRIFVCRQARQVLPASSDRLATQEIPGRREKFLCGIVTRWHAMPRAPTPF